MTPEERLSLIKEVGEEIIEENELLELLKNKKKLNVSKLLLSVINKNFLNKREVL